MRSVNPNMYPKGGYYFIESDGARIFGDTWPGVIRRVAAYRRRAGHPEGNPNADVINQACQRDPTICVETNQAYAAKLSESSLKSRVLAWLSGIRARREKELLPFSVEQDSRNRAAVCAQCSKNTPLPGGCATCKAVVTELEKDLLGRRFIDGRLNACIVLGEDLPVSVHLEQTTVDNAELPPNCWRKRTL
jgi:hypothetical protein